jgi:hypothetical protein
MKKGAILTIVALFLASAASGAALTTTWQGGDGDWETPANWDNGVPLNNGNTFTAVTDGGGSTITYQTDDSTIDKLEIKAGDKVQYHNGASTYTLYTTDLTIAAGGTLQLRNHANHGNRRKYFYMTGTSFTNDGTIHAWVSRSKTGIDSRLYFDNVTSAINNGTITMEATHSTDGKGRATASFGGALTNNGTVEILDGPGFERAYVAVTNAYTQNGAATRTTVGDADTSTGYLSASTVAINGGLLEGTGHIKSSVSIGAATLAPGASVGTLSVTGDVVLGSNATFLVEVADPDADLLDVTGAVTLDGELTVSGFAGGEYMIISATDGISGAFDELNGNQVEQRNSDTELWLVPGAATIIPEPLSAVAVMLGAGALARYVRRRRA